MQVSYIRYKEAEQLLKLYPDLQATSENIRLQMDNIRGTEVTADDILGMALPHTNFDGIPNFSKGTTGDRTAKVALNYESALKHETQETLRELRVELLLVKTVIDKLDVALSILPALQRDIIVSRCCDGLKWPKLVDKINKDEYVLSVTAAKVRYREGIERLSRVCRVTLSEYTGIMKLFS